MRKFLKFSVLFLALGLIFSSCDKDLDNNNIVRNIDGKTATGAAVMVMDTTMVSLKLQGISANGTLKFNNLSAEDMPEKGDIICSAPSKAAPQGFLYKVKEVTTKGNETTIVTEMATIAEAVEEASVNQTFDLTVGSIEEVEGVEIVEMQKAPSQFRSTQGSLPDMATSIKFRVDMPILLPDNLPAHIKGSIELKNTFHSEMELDSWNLKHLELTTQPQFKAQLALEMDCELLKKEETIHITTLTYAPVTIWAGVVPIVFSPEISIDGIITLSGKIKLQATFIKWDYSYTLGIGYDNGHFAPINKNTSQPAKYLDDTQFNLSLSAELKSELKFSGKCNLYNTGSGIDLYASPYAELKVESKSTEENPKETFKCGLEFGAEAELRIFSKEIAKQKFTFGKVEWTIWEKIWGLTADINNIISDEYLEELEDLGLDINYGYNPPMIEGTYLMSPMRHVRSNFFEWGTYTYDCEETFYNQNINDLTIQMNTHTFNKRGFVDNSESTSTGIGSYIVGHDNLFSVFVKSVSLDVYGNTTEGVSVISGELVDGGIRNYQDAFIMVDDHGDPRNIYIENGQGRLSKDGDGFSEKIGGGGFRSSSTPKSNLPSIISIKELN